MQFNRYINRYVYIERDRVISNRKKNKFVSAEILVVSNNSRAKQQQQQQQLPWVLMIHACRALWSSEIIGCIISSLTLSLPSFLRPVRLSSLLSSPLYSHCFCIIGLGDIVAGATPARKCPPLIAFFIRFYDQLYSRHKVTRGSRPMPIIQKFPSSSLTLTPCVSVVVFSFSLSLHCFFLM